MFSRTAGLRFGPDIDRPETPVIPDVLAAVDELLLACASLAILGRRRRCPLLPGPLQLALIVSLPGAVLSGDHSH